MAYQDTSLLIDGAWGPSAAGRWLEVLNPATGEPAGKVAHAGREDLDRALEAAAKGFEVWRRVNAFERSKVMRKAATVSGPKLSSARWTLRKLAPQITESAMRRSQSARVGLAGCKGVDPAV